MKAGRASRAGSARLALCPASHAVRRRPCAARQRRDRSLEADFGCETNSQRPACSVRYYEKLANANKQYIAGSTSTNLIYEAIVQRRLQEFEISTRLDQTLKHKDCAAARLHGRSTY